MTHINLTEAQQKLGELVTAIGQGEEFILTLRGEPVAKMTGIDSVSNVRRFGSASGLIEIADDFDEPLAEFSEYM